MTKSNETAPGGMNESASGTATGTELTQTCSGFDLTYENDRRALHRVRNRIHANSPDGHTYSNILELRENWEKSRPGDFAQQHLPRLMLEQEKRLRVEEA